VIIPHDDKKYRGGEDSASTSSHLLVVADGVGGWASKGVNPGLYSKLLTQTIVETFEQMTKKRNKGRTTEKDDDDDDDVGMTVDLVKLVDVANDYASSKHLGTATCTAVQLVGPNTLHTLNIGDSGYSIHRRDRRGGGGGSERQRLDVVYASEPGQKQFNFPHQIGGRYGDVVSDVADVQTHTVEDGDIIVVYSDGVSDNVYPKEYHDCIDRYTVEETIVSFALVADCIARQAYALGKDRTYDSPFAQGARKVGKRYLGGKHDDITVTVAQIIKKKKTSSSPATTTSGPSAAPSSRDDGEEEGNDDDPHFTESIFIYTGPVPSKDELPSVEEVLARKPVAATAGGDEL
jgi:protein phosphatase PTC7